MPAVKLTMLNGMADRDIRVAMDRHVAWGLTELDLKDSIRGKEVGALSDEEAGEVRGLADARGLRVTCVSSKLFQEDLELGEGVMRRLALGPLPRLLEISAILRPRFVRLLAPVAARRPGIPDAAAWVRERHPWLLGLYREAIDRIGAAGFLPTIENEKGGCILGRPGEISDFYAMLDLPGRIGLTWDTGNMWQAGAIPTIAVYEALKPLIRYVHLKGGMAGAPGGGLWKSALSDATWPVLEVTRRVVADGVSPVICLNPPHGKRKEGYDYTGLVERDIRFLRENVPGIE